MQKLVLAAVLAVGVIVSVMTGRAAFAAHPLITDDTGTQGRGNFQMETTGTWFTDQENKNGEGLREISSFATIALAAGIAETVDLIVCVPYIWTETREAETVTTENGISDTVMEAKWRFYAKQNLSLAIKPGIVLPTGDEDKGLGTGHFGYTTFLIATVETEPWAFYANLGYLYLENRVDERVNLWLGSIASRLSVSERWTIVGEVGAARNTDPAESSHPAFAQIGLIYSPNDHLDLSAGLLAGLSDSEVDQSVRAGVTIRF
jgi:hypothetical protein